MQMSDGSTSHGIVRLLHLEREKGRYFWASACSTVDWQHRSWRPKQEENETMAKERGQREGKKEEEKKSYVGGAR
jgi:hypothetical protein